MNAMRLSPLLLLAALAILGVAPMTALAEEVEAVDGAGEALDQMDIDVFVLQPEQFDSWVFNNHTAESARSQSLARIGLQVDFVESAVPLDAAQRAKLDLAGRGDVHRFFNEFRAIKSSLPTGKVKQDEWQKVWTRTQPLQMKYLAGLHGPGSLFDRAIRTTLATEQLEKYDRMTEDRLKRQYAASVRLTVAEIETRIPLTADQRRRFVDAILSSSTPPRKVGQPYAERYYVMHQIAKVPEETLKAIFTDKEWKRLKATIDPWRNAQFLQQLGEQGIEF